MKHASSVLAIVLAAGLAGCAAVRRPPPALPSSTPPAFVETPEGAAAAEPDLAGWWTRFGDPTLDRLVGQALAGNLDLQTAAQRIEEARQQEVIAGARRLPQAQLDTSASRNRISEHAIPIPPGAGGGAGGAPSVFGLPGAEFSSFHLGADASWEFDLFGGAASAARGAKARRESAQWRRRDLQVAVAAEVASHYIALRALQRREAVAWDELTRQRQLLELARARADAGVATGAEVAQQQAAASAAEARAYPLEAGARAEIHALGVLVGETPEALVKTLTPPAAVPAAPVPPPGLPSDLLRRRPDIRRAERDVAAAAADVGVAVADLYPKITLSAQPSLVSTSLSSLVEWGSRNYALSAGLLWPIFEGGRLRARLAGANARQAEALIAYRQAVLNALKEVEDALSRVQADEAAAGSLRASLESASAARTAALDQYKAGVQPYLGVLTAEQAVTTDQDQLAQADNARAQDVVALYRALGGGWRDDEPTGPKEAKP